MLILHGEHELASRAKLIELSAAAKTQGKIVRWLDGKKITTADLELAMGSDSLFGTSQLIIVEQVTAGPKSRRKDELLKWLQNFNSPTTSKTQVKNQSTEIVLWETKTLSPTQLKAFVGTEVQFFKLPSAIFTWLDSLTPGSISTKAHQLKLLAAAVEAESSEFCHLMLQRQVRLLIQAKEGFLPAMAPFAATKLKAQAQRFTTDQLLNLHAQLFKIDKRQKTGTSPANLCQELEVLITKI